MSRPAASRWKKRISSATSSSRIHGFTGAQTLVIDHDVDLIARVCAETLVLDFGRRIAFGPTADVLADAKVKAAYLGTAEV